jgi:uncharacterized membrane protein
MATHRVRIDAIDALRGLVIVFMVMDHAREYSAGPGGLTDPMNLDTVSPLLFWMRWLAHFCAPVFTLLAGVSAGFQTARSDDAVTSEIEASRTQPWSWHFIVRGMILIALEFTLVHYSWTFSTVWPMRYAQVIWGIGVGLVVFGLLQRVPPLLRAAIGIACVAGHNLLDSWHPTSPPVLHWVWAILHDRQVMPLWGDLTVRTSYPVLPMIGLVLVGEALGRWYIRTLDDGVRRQTLVRVGAACIVLFVVLRLTNLYGDPHDAVYGGSVLRDLQSMLNVTKYPMSLSFVLMTLGPALLVLARWDARVPRWMSPLVVMGQVPMFLYVAHLYALHAFAMLWALAVGFPWSAFDFTANIGGMPKGFGFPLWVTIPFSLITVVALWPAARWYARLRTSKRYAITRYF